MRTINSSRRTTLKLLLAGSVVSIATGCETLNSLPRGNAGSTDGDPLSIEVREALRNHPSTGGFTFDISAREDEIVIKGFVPSQGDVANVEIIANQVPGVRHVLMDLYVR